MLATRATKRSSMATSTSVRAAVAQKGSRLSSGLLGGTGCGGGETIGGIGGLTIGGGGLTIGGLTIGGTAVTVGGGLTLAALALGAPLGPASVVGAASASRAGAPASGRNAASPVSSLTAVIAPVGMFIGGAGIGGAGIGGTGIGGGDRSTVHPRRASAAPNAARVTSAGVRGEGSSDTSTRSGVFAFCHLDLFAAIPAIVAASRRALVTLLL